MDDKIKLNINDWNIKKTERSRGRMKITFKLNKEEAEAFKNWEQLVRPDNVDIDTFYKTVFSHGVQYLNMMLTDLAQKEKARLDLEEQKKNSLEGVENSVKPETTPLKIVE